MNDGPTFSLAERCGADGVAQTTAVVQVRDFPSSVAELPTVGRGRKFSRSRAGFSLLEVMIASGIFFMCVFTILAMVSSLLRNARSLRRIELDAGMVAAQLCKTNRLFEGTESGDFGDLYQAIPGRRKLSGGNQRTLAGGHRRAPAWHHTAGRQHERLCLFTGIAIRVRPLHLPLMTPPHSRLRSAFTLVEIMIAICLLSLVLAAIYSSWTAILRASRTGLDAAATAQRARIAVRVLEDSLSSAQSFAANLPVLLLFRAKRQFPRA